MRKLPWLVKPVKRISKSGIDATAIRNTREWRDRVRPKQLTKYPECAHCNSKGILRLATEVDHITPLEVGGKPFDEDNLQSLCKRCHGAKTGEENRERMKRNLN